ncbi:MAG: hypothetical protein IT426_19950 [Pirellulales bacterium]|nr:hypothetical protein [Pirellulales bacterium]
MAENIARILQIAGKTSEIYDTPDGTRLLMLPYGARVLGLFPARGGDNFYWTHPALDRAETARTLFSQEIWHNTGGDRTWIAPELDVNYADADFERYCQPRQLDRGDFRVERGGGGCRLSRDVTLQLNRSGGNVRLRLSKWFGPAPNPLRHERDAAEVLGAVDYAGYAQRIAMQSLDDPFQPSALLGIWNLIQLPEGGELIAPIYARTVPQRCFGDASADRVAVEDRCVRLNAGFPGSYKLALKAAAACGRVGYVYRQGAAHSLVVRNFFVNPSGRYVDVQRHDLEDFGYAVQLCRIDDAVFGSYCELEYHAPAWGDLPDPPLSEDVSQVWAFRGPRDAIDAVAYKLLGAKSSPRV